MFRLRTPDYEFDESFEVTNKNYLGDEKAIKMKMDNVANSAQKQLQDL